MKNLLFLLLFISTFSIISCCEKENNLTEASSSSSNQLNLENISPQMLFNEIKNLNNAPNFMDSFVDIYKANELKNVTNYLLPDSTVNKLITAARIPNNQTRSVFFNYNQIESLIQKVKSDPNYNATDTFGISIYFGEYTKEIINEINGIHSGANIPETLAGRKTLILRPSILLKNGNKDSLMLLKAIDGYSSLNLGDLCPPNCPKND